MTQKQVIELLKTGNFTIAYHDNGSPYLYKGHMTYEELEEEGDTYDFPNDFLGYCPEVVELLVKALGGKALSI